jgi:hypothetical protein
MLGCCLVVLQQDVPYDVADGSTVLTCILVCIAAYYGLGFLLTLLNTPIC